MMHCGLLSKSSFSQQGQCSFALPLNRAWMIAAR
jgi:hypothetical protein